MLDSFLESFQYPHIFGSIAGTLTTLCFIPQALKVLKTKETGGISLLMYLLFTVGVAFWLAYGIALQSWPMIIANSLTLFLAMLILLSVARARSRKN